MALFNGRMYCVRDSGGRSTRTRVEAAGDSESSTTKTTGSQTPSAQDSGNLYLRTKGPPSPPPTA